MDKLFIETCPYQKSTSTSDRERDRLRQDHLYIFKPTVALRWMCIELARTYLGMGKIEREKTNKSKKQT